jgi:aspartate aminotransferase
MGYRAVRPRGGFYVFAETPLADDLRFVSLLKEESILVVPGTGFGRPGHMRLSVTVARQAIERSLAGFARALETARRTPSRAG